jgi:HSP20 family protein
MLWPRMRRDPWWTEEVDRLRREMDRLAEGVGRRPFQGFETRLFPLLNVRDKGDSFVVSAEIPGMKTDDLEIKMEGETLTLKGERKPHEAAVGASHHRRERATGIFQRSLTLPGKVDPDKVNATYKNGVLTVTLVKEKAAIPRQITVKAE